MIAFLRNPISPFEPIRLAPPERPPCYSLSFCIIVGHSSGCFLPEQYQFPAPMNYNILPTTKRYYSIAQCPFSRLFCVIFMRFSHSLQLGVFLFMRMKPKALKWCGFRRWGGRGFRVFSSGRSVFYLPHLHHRSDTTIGRERERFSQLRGNHFLNGRLAHFCGFSFDDPVCFSSFLSRLIFE